MMGDTWRWLSGLSAHDHVAFGDLGQQQVTEANRPDTVVGLLQANEVVGKGVGQEQQYLLEADGAGVGQLLEQEVAGYATGRSRSGQAWGNGWRREARVCPCRPW